MNNTQGGIHVVRNPDAQGWATEANGEVVSTHHSKAVAIRTGRRLAKRHGEPLTVHSADGTVMSTHSYEIRPI